MIVTNGRWWFKKNAGVWWRNGGRNFNSQASARYQRILLIAKVLCAIATWLRGITVNLVNKVLVIPKILKNGCESTFIPSHYQHESEQFNVDKHRNELNYSKAHGAGGRTSTKLLGFGLGRGKGNRNFFNMFLPYKPRWHFFLLACTPQ